MKLGLVALGLGLSFAFARISAAAPAAPVTPVTPVTPAPPLPPPASAEPQEVPSAPAQAVPRKPSPPAAPEATTASAAVELRLSNGPSRPSKDAAARAPRETDIDADRVLHGFRIGASYTLRYEDKVEGLGGKSLREVASMRAPAHFLLGYEVVYRVTSGSWLNVILLGNAMVAGLEQSKFYPSVNGLLGFELGNAFQLGVGTNLSPLRGSEAHAIVAAGWTPRVGKLYVPVHGFFIPDVDGVHRLGMTTGVTF
jgi:hypothetical protein